MGAVPNSFMADVLAQIRAPESGVNIQNLQTWRRYEGGTALWNPLNDTDRRPGSTEYNSAGVQNYPNAAIGVSATAGTLQNGRYTAILVKLRDSAPLALWNDPSVLEQINTWGTHGFAAYIRTLAPPPQPQQGEAVFVAQGPAGQGDYLVFDNGATIPIGAPATAADFVRLLKLEVVPVDLEFIQNCAKKATA